MGVKKDMIKYDTIVVMGWMLNTLGLIGDELMIYALIYGFSQIEDQYYRGSIDYIAEWLSCDEEHAENVLRSLISKGLVSHSSNGYRAVTKGNA